jgi:hypothetical protein
MKRAALIGHLSIPAIVTLGTFAVAVRREPFGMGMFSTYVLGGYLFYAAPHLLWSVIAAVAKASLSSLLPLWVAGRRPDFEKQPLARLRA